ncbi:hypothetical protein ACOBQJ_06330 [Pelotomaculum propionicicum]|uniref:hypothetical protein n=1 Tax=Pelotomaculum propionicicum TaxID=258475 RepID=UPI003B7ED642
MRREILQVRLQPHIFGGIDPALQQLGMAPNGWRDKSGLTGWLHTTAKQICRKYRCPASDD